MLGLPNYEQRENVLGKLVPTSMYYNCGIYIGFSATTGLSNCITVSNSQYLDCNQYATIRGLKVGDSRQKVLELYGNNGASCYSWMTYWSEDLKNSLGIGICDDKVCSISISTN